MATHVFPFKYDPKEQDVQSVTSGPTQVKQVEWQFFEIIIKSFIPQNWIKGLDWL